VTVPVTRLPTPAGIGQYGPVPVVPPKLRSGSSVRVIAPSRSLAIIGPEVRAEADRKLAALGLTVSFGERVSECDAFSSSPAAARLADLHAAFADPGVDAILTVIGGFNANQLLTGRTGTWSRVRAGGCCRRARRTGPSWAATCAP
jgi:muramoyltetrapeptide carboxypeptidase LdcA involved in peptidoglycan recycling